MNMAQDRAALPRFDKAQALVRVGGDEDLLKEVAALFLDDIPNMVAAIDQAISKGDPKAIERAAHTLKGCVSNFGAADAHDAALELEKMGREQSIARAQDGYAVLLTRLEELKPELQSFIGRA